jgi:crotonobetainyl-CoA:carnitine CoA-transferase CaiB-like acyl-CoA transferase
MATMVLQEHLAAHSFDPPVGPYGDQRLLSPHNQPIKTKDGFIAVTINTDPQVQAFLKATGRGDLIADLRFSSVSARAVHVAEWFEIRGAPLNDRTSDEWLQAFRAADIAAMPIHSIESLAHDPHLTAVNLMTEEDHPTEGRTTVLRSSVRADGATLSPRSPSAPRGWHTVEILEELGFSGSAAKALLDEGAAVTA